MMSVLCQSHVVRIFGIFPFVFSVGFCYRGLKVGLSKGVENPDMMVSAPDVFAALVSNREDLAYRVCQ